MGITVIENQVQTEYGISEILNNYIEERNDYEEAMKYYNKEQKPIEEEQHETPQSADQSDILERSGSVAVES